MATDTTAPAGTHVEVVRGPYTPEEIAEIVRVWLQVQEPQPRRRHRGKK